MSSVTKKSIFNYLYVEPVRKMKSWSVARFRFSQIMHVRTNGFYSNVVFFLFKYLYPKIKLPTSKISSKKEIDKTVLELNEKGFSILDFSLSPNELKSILKFTREYPTYGQFENEGIFFDALNPPTKSARYIWKISDLIQNDVVQKLMKDSLFHNIAQNYLCSRPILSHITLWLDPVSDNKNYQPHVYHYDLDGPKFLKFFFYISDVDINSCPHSYIQGTHSWYKDKAFLKAKRYTDKEVLDFYGKENEIVFTAPAGTVIAEDTLGFHKGSVPKTGYRLLLQLEYTIQDIPYFNNIENEHQFKKSKIAGLDKNIKKIIGKLFE